MSLNAALNPFLLAIIAISLLALASCQSGSPSQSQSLNVKQSATDAVVRIAKAAQQCWFKSGDAAFRNFKTRQ